MSHTPTTPVTPDDTTGEELRASTEAAASASAHLDGTTPDERTGLLRAVADALDQDGMRLVEIADAETSLGTPRLSSELARTTGQLRLFADVVREGSFVEATIDTADPTATPPQPDLRRVLHAIGPVAVFSASNFPFAFSVAGGDTASALAAGCPVIVKAHPGHPRLSRAVSETIGSTLTRQGTPTGTFACVFGVEIGRELVQDPNVSAVGFTGSVTGGRALFDLATGRPDPIPFYGELGSVNPAVVTAAAARRRAEEIASGLVESFTLGTGQFCTKPGVVLVPEDAHLDDVLAEHVPPEPAPMLNDRIASGFHDGVAELGQHPRVRVVIGPVEQHGITGTPVVFSATANDLLDEPEFLLEERFGPSCLLVTYRNDDELRAALRVLPGSLGISVHAEDDERSMVHELLRPLTERGGRLIWNGWPTGVAVSWSMHHGGPWPATTAPLHTSVGATAVRRFLRPVCYQDWPNELLPPALRDANPLNLPRRLNGVITSDPVR